jgi:predicted MFS family arabinose efflux permease
MNASMRFIIWGTMPLGALLGGWLGSVWGLHPTLWVGAVGGFLAPLWLLRTAVRRLPQAPSPAAQASS